MSNFIINAIKAITTTAFKCPANKGCTKVDDCDKSCKNVTATQPQETPKEVIIPSKGNFDH